MLSKKSLLSPIINGLVISILINKLIEAITDIITAIAVVLFSLFNTELTN